MTKISNVFYANTQIIEHERVHLPYWLTQSSMRWKSKARMQMMPTKSNPLVNIIRPGYFTDEIEFNYSTIGYRLALANYSLSDAPLTLRPNLDWISCARSASESRSTDTAVYNPIVHPGNTEEDETDHLYSRALARNLIRTAGSSPFLPDFRVGQMRCDVELEGTQSDRSIIYVPFYKYTIAYGKTRFDVFVNGCDGSIFGLPRFISVWSVTALSGAIPTLLMATLPSISPWWGLLALFPTLSITFVNWTVWKHRQDARTACEKAPHFDIKTALEKRRVMAWSNVEERIANTQGELAKSFCAVRDATKSATVQSIASSVESVSLLSKIVPTFNVNDSEQTFINKQALAEFLTLTEDNSQELKTLPSLASLYVTRKSEYDSSLYSRSPLKNWAREQVMALDKAWNDIWSCP